MHYTDDDISQDIRRDLPDDFLIPDENYEGGFNKGKTPACAVVGGEADDPSANVGKVKEEFVYASGRNAVPHSKVYMTCLWLLCPPLRVWSAAGPFLSMVLYFYCLAHLTTSSVCFLIVQAFLVRFPHLSWTLLSPSLLSPRQLVMRVVCNTIVN